MKGAKSLNLLLTFCLFTATSLYGQASYYYYGNKRIDLEDVPGRSFILLNAEDTSSFLQLLSETASPIRTLTVYDLAGRVMMTAEGGTVETCHGASLQVDVSSLPNGIYLLRAVTDSGVQTGRFVKK